MGGRSGVEMLYMKDAQHPFWRGIDTDRLWRMNGERQAVFQFALVNLPAGADVLAEGKESCYDKDFYAAVAEVKAGKGSIMFSQLKLRGRLDDKAADYDPAAMIILYNLLSWK